jgi:transcriptional regulator with XRE-family HTH domain
MVSKISKKGAYMDIREERKSRGWSVQYVAEQTGVSNVTIYNIETKKKKPSLETYHKLMSLFGYQAPRLTVGTDGGEISNLPGSISESEEAQ